MTTKVRALRGQLALLEIGGEVWEKSKGWDGQFSYPFLLEVVRLPACVAWMAGDYQFHRLIALNNLGSVARNLYIRIIPLNSIRSIGVRLASIAITYLKLESIACLIIYSWRGSR